MNQAKSPILCRVGDFALRLPATGRNFPDGLVSGALAGVSKSGVVLTMCTNAVEPEVLSKLQTVGTRKVTIVCGVGVVSSEVENSLRNTGIQVERIAGTVVVDILPKPIGILPDSLFFESPFA